MRKNFKDVGFYPQPVLIIGTYDADGVPDAMNVGWGGLVEIGRASCRERVLRLV